MEAELERVLARAGMAVGGQAVGERRGARARRRDPATSRPWLPSSEQTLTCSSAPRSSSGRQPLVARRRRARGGRAAGRSRAPLSRAAAASKSSSMPSNGHSSSSQGARGGPWAIRSSSARRQHQRVLVGELAAGVQAHGEAGAVDLAAAPRRGGRPARGAATRGKCARLTCGVQATSRTPSACRRRAWRRVSSIVVAPSSMPGRRWQCRSTYDTAIRASSRRPSGKGAVTAAKRSPNARRNHRRRRGAHADPSAELGQRTR